MDIENRTTVSDDIRHMLKEPGMYAVIFYNDEITTMDFVVEILIKVFHKPAAEAASIMMDVHDNGQGVAGVYTYDIAMTKKKQADLLSANKGFPLRIEVSKTTEEG